MRNLFGGLSISLGLIILVVVGLAFESLIPGAILHFAAGWDFLKSVLLCMAAQAALFLAIVGVLGGFAALASR